MIAVSPLREGTLASARTCPRSVRGHVFYPGSLPSGYGSNKINWFRGIGCDSSVQERMHLHGCLGLAEHRPGKGGKAQGDGGGVQRIGRLLEIQNARIARMQLARLSDQNLGKVRVNVPVAQFVGIGQGAVLHRASGYLEEPRSCGAPKLRILVSDAPKRSGRTSPKRSGDGARRSERSIRLRGLPVR